MLKMEKHVAWTCNGLFRRREVGVRVKMHRNTNVTNCIIPHSLFLKLSVHHNPCL